MTEYIDKNATVGILEAMSRNADCECIKKRLEKAAKRVNTMPAADVAPVVYGRWENGNPICPVCGGDKFKDLDADIWCDWQPAFCPNCGAKMDLEEG